MHSSRKEALDYLQTGNRAASSGDLSTAIDCFSAGLSLEAKSSGLFLNRSIAYERLEQKSEAFSDLEQYLSLVKECSEQSMLALKRFIALGESLGQRKRSLKCLQELELRECWHSTQFYELLIHLTALDPDALKASLTHYLERATSLGCLSQASFENALSILQYQNLANSPDSFKSSTDEVVALLMQLMLKSNAPQFILHRYLSLLASLNLSPEDLAEQSIHVLFLWVQVHPLDAAATERLIQFLFEQNQVDLIEALFLELSKRFPSEPNYLLGLARARFFKRDLERAFVVINAALDLDEKNLEIRLVRARLFEQLLNPHLALVDLNQNLKLNPDHLPSLVAKVNALADLGKLDEALKLHDDLINRDLSEEDRVGLELSKSFAYRIAGRINEWIAHVDCMAERFPDQAEALCELGWKEVYLGNWKKGFALFEHRFAPGIHFFPVQPHIDFAKIPKWTKELFQSSVSGKHLLLCGEEGMGDVVQFSRFIPLLLARGLKITYMCKEALHSLFAYNFPQLRLISPGALINELQNSPASPYDFYGEIMSIPWLLDLSVADLSGKPYLKVMPQKIVQMARFKQEKMAQDDKHPALGLRWVSSMARSGRTIPLEDLKPIAQLPISIFGLHHGPIKQAEQQLYAGWPHFYPTELELEDLAGLMMNLDCIVTSDTMTAHLAGALGRPTIMLKPVFIDWRWGDNSHQSIWYDSIHVIRQHQMRDWTLAIDQLKQELSQRFNLSI